MKHFKNEFIFFSCPFSSNNGRIDYVMPPLTALSSKSTRQKASYYYPVLCSKLVNSFFESLIFLFGPLCAAYLSTYFLRRRSMTNLYVRHLAIRVLYRCSLINFLEVQPSFEAPNFCLIWHKLTKSVPRLVTINFNKVSKLLIFLCCPHNLLSWSLSLSCSFLLFVKLTILLRCFL